MKTVQSVCEYQPTRAPAEGPRSHRCYCAAATTPLLPPLVALGWPPPAAPPDGWHCNHNKQGGVTGAEPIAAVHSACKQLTGVGPWALSSPRMRRPAHQAHVGQLTQQPPLCHRLRGGGTTRAGT